jgi:uncharacterized protein DUF1217
MDVALTYLTSLYKSGSTTGSGSLLATLYGFAGQSTASGQNAAAALTSAEKNQTKRIEATAQQPEVKRAIDAFTKGVSSAKSVSALLADPNVMRVLLTANGLADQMSYTALARRALQSDLNDPKSLANTLSDTRWKSVAQTYDFAAKGLGVIQKPEVISAVADAYAEVVWRQSLDATTPGLSNALTFRAEAAKFTSADQILGDPVMRKVVTTALGIPLQIAFQPLEAQERAITSKLDVSKLQDPKFVENFAQRYLLAANGSGTNGSTTTSTDLSTLAVKSRGLIV